MTDSPTAPIDLSGKASEHFARVASDWSARYQQRPSFLARLAIVSQAIDGILKGRHGKSVLDIGGGTGIFAAVASAWADEVIVVDPSSAMVQAGTENRLAMVALLRSAGLTCRLNCIRWVVGDIDCLSPSITERFNLVLAIAVLEYMNDVPTTVRRLLQLTTPSGSVLLTVPRPRSLIRRMERPLDYVAVRIGSAAGYARLARRDYASLRPHGSSVPWQEAIDPGSAAIRQHLALPLGTSGWRRHVNPSELVHVVSTPVR